MSDDFEVPGRPPTGTATAAEMDEGTTEVPQAETPSSGHLAPTRPPDHPGGLPPVQQSADELRQLQEAQAAHAFTIQAEDLARRFPVVRQLREKLAAAELEVTRLRGAPAAAADPRKRR